MDEATRKHFPGAANPRGGLYSAPVPKAMPPVKTPSRLKRILQLSELRTHLESSRDAWLGSNTSAELKARKVKEIEGHLGLVEEPKRETAVHHSAAQPPRGTEDAENGVNG